MSNPELFDRIRHRLNRAGVPRGQVDRLLAELEDHYCESVSAEVDHGLSIEQAQDQSLAAIGSEDQIVKTTLRMLVRETWVGRHRMTCLIVVPLLIYPFVSLIPVLGGMWLVKKSGLSSAGWAAEIAKWVALLTCYIALPVSWLAWLTQRSRRHFYGNTYKMAARMIVLLWSLLLVLQIKLPQTAAGQWSVTLGTLNRISPSYFTEPCRVGLGLIYLGLLVRWLQSRRKQNLTAAGAA